SLLELRLAVLHVGVPSPPAPELALGSENGSKHFWSAVVRPEIAHSRVAERTAERNASDIGVDHRLPDVLGKKCVIDRHADVAEIRRGVARSIALDVARRAVVAARHGFALRDRACIRKLGEYSKGVGEVVLDMSEKGRPLDGIRGISSRRGRLPFVLRAADHVVAIELAVAEFPSLTVRQKLYS